MSNDFLSENSKNTTLDVNPIGPKLKNAREALRLTVLDIARQLRLKPECIEALENDQYADMPGATFAKGYLRAYAVLINLSGDEIIADFDRLKMMSERQTFILPPQKEPMSFKQRPVRLTVFVGFFLLILIAIWWNVFSEKDVAPPVLPQQAVVLPAQPTVQRAVSSQTEASQNNPVKTQSLPVANEKNTPIQSNVSNNLPKAAENSQSLAPAKATMETSTVEEQGSVRTDDAVVGEANTVKKIEKKSRKSHAKLAEPFE